MGNQLVSLRCNEHIQTSDLSPQEKRNLKIYLWRSASEKNQYISRVKLNFSNSSIQKNQTINCFEESNFSSPNIIFEEYVSDFRPLKAYLNTQEMITVFRCVLKGHQTIFSQFGASIINERSCFLTHDGCIRVWINPNYYLNEFWQSPKQQFRLRSSSAHEMNCQTPRFMNKEEFNFQTTVKLTSQSTIIRKIIDFITQLSVNCDLSLRFFEQLNQFLQQNTLFNCNFVRIQRFINKFAYENKILVKSNIQSAVRRLIDDAVIFADDTNQNEKNHNKHTRSRKISVLQEFQTPEISKPNPSFDGSFNEVSVLNIKNNSRHQIYNENQNFSRLLGTTLNEIENSKIVQVSEQKQQNALFSSKKTSIKQKCFKHKRKLSRSLVQQTKMIQSARISEQVPIIRSQAFKTVVNAGNFYQTKTKQGFYHRQKPQKNLNFSYQFSINLHTSGINKITELSSDQTSSRKPVSWKNESDQSVDRIMKDQNSENGLRISTNSKNGSILKKSHIRTHHNGQNQENNEPQQRDSLTKQKHPIIILPRKNTSQRSSNKQNMETHRVRRSSDGSENYNIPDELNLTVHKEDMFKTFQEQQLSLKKTLKIPQTTRTAAKTRQNSQLYPENNDLIDKGYQQPFYEIYSYQTPKVSPRVYQNQRQADISSVSINKLLVASKQSSPQCLNSMMINVHKIDDEVEAEKIRSKRRISVGADDFKSKQLRNFFDSYSPYTNHQINGAEKTVRTITKLFSSSNKLQASIGSLSSDDDFSQSSDGNASKYTGILTKMGRSVPFRKVPDQIVVNTSEQDKSSKSNFASAMPNFTKKRSIYEHGSNRSMKV